MMKGSKCCGVHMAAYWLLIVGGLNWLLVGVANWNLVEVLFGNWPVVVRIVYVAVGLSAIAMLLQGSCSGCKGCEMCGMKK